MRQQATIIVQCDDCVASDVCEYLYSPGAHRTLPDKVAVHTADVRVCTATLSAVVRCVVQKLWYAQCCALALLQRRAQPTSGSCRCAGRTAYGASVPMVLRVLMYSFVPGRSFSTKSSLTRTVSTMNARSAQAHHALPTGQTAQGPSRSCFPRLP